MNKLTKFQKDMLLENFFKIESCAGWKEIANSLLDTGSCIVAGEKCIWLGGIGNYINTFPAGNTYGCVTYEFNLNDFLHSMYFCEFITNYVSQLEIKRQNIMNEYAEIADLPYLTK